jgi:hypothetical protein
VLLLRATRECKPDLYMGEDQVAVWERCALPHPAMKSTELGEDLDGG